MWSHTSSPTFYYLSKLFFGCCIILRVYGLLSEIGWKNISLANFFELTVVKVVVEDIWKVGSSSKDIHILILGSVNMLCYITKETSRMQYHLCVYNREIILDYVGEGLSSIITLALKIKNFPWLWWKRFSGIREKEILQIGKSAIFQLREEFNTPLLALKGWFPYLSLYV